MKEIKELQETAERLMKEVVNGCLEMRSDDGGRKGKGAELDLLDEEELEINERAHYSAIESDYKEPKT